MGQKKNKYTVVIREIDKVKEFVRMCEKWEYDIDCKRGRLICDGKSLLGLIALDTSTPFMVEIHCDDIEDLLVFYENMQAFQGTVVEE